MRALNLETRDIRNVLEEMLQVPGRVSTYKFRDDVQANKEG